MSAYRQGSFILGGAIAVAMALTDCNCGGTKTGTVEGRMAAAVDAPDPSGQALKLGRTHRVGVSEQALAVDSPETSLTGLTLDLIEYRGMPGVEKGSVGTATPDATGRFSFAEIPVMGRKPPDNGMYVIKINQSAAARVTYGAEGQFKWLAEGETLSMSLPLLTRVQLPLWVDPAHVPPPNYGYVAVQIAVDDVTGKLVYFTPHRGLGVYDPAQGTVDVLSMPAALSFSRSESVLHVVQETGQVILALYRSPQEAARFFIIDLDIFSSDAVSELLNYDDPGTAATLASKVTVIDVPGDMGLTSPPGWTSGMGSNNRFLPTSAAASDGSHFYLGAQRLTYVFDLSARTLAATWWDGGSLGAHDPVTDQLFFDMQNGVLRVRDAKTMALVGDVAISAYSLLGVTPLGDEGQTLVAFESSATPGEQRFAVVGAGATVVSDQASPDFLGFTDRFWDPAYDWGTCTKEFFKGDECPACGPRPTDLPNLGPDNHRGGNPLFFNAERNQLVLPQLGAAFERRDGVFYPMPSLFCGRFDMAPSCNGVPLYDAPSNVSLMSPVGGSGTVCLMHVDASDLTIPVTIAGSMSNFSTPAFASAEGVVYVASDQALTAIYYNNTDAVSQPAVRDLTGEVTVP